MDSSAHPLDSLHAFRDSLYRCFERRADALFELTDAILTAGSVPSPVHLSLAAVHRRGWGSLYAALSKGRIDEGRLRGLLSEHPLGDGSLGDPPIYAVDVSVWSRCDAEASPGRGYYYHPSRHSAGQPIVAGWAYQLIAGLSFERDSWVAPTDARRVRPEEDVNEVAVAQVKDLLRRQYGTRGVVPLFVFDAGYDPVKLQRGLEGYRAHVLVRLHSNRTFYADPEELEPRPVVFAVAPGAVLQPIRVSNDQGGLVGVLCGFMRAKELNPSIITISCSSDNSYPPTNGPDEYEREFALQILDATDNGILVVFAAGNSTFGIEPQVPGVLAVGGVYISATQELRASDYASGYQSPWYDDVTVPAVCGLVGRLPRAHYLMLPVPPGGEIDVSESEPAPNDSPDGTMPNDGWALFSGTSAAAPQVAGAAALILGAKPGLKPPQVIEALTETATDITAGCCHSRFNNCAGVGHDSATGHGLANAAAAVKYAIERF